MSYFGFILANLGRNKLRSALTGGAVMLAVLLVCLLLTMPAGLNALVQRATSNTRISVHHKAGLAYVLPYSFTRKVRQVDGVEGAVATLWFGGAFEEAGKVTFPNFSVEPEHIPAVFPDYGIAPQQLADFRRYRDGAIVGRQTMRRYRWKIGDRITLESTVMPLKLDLRIVGEIPNEQNPLLWLSREYVEQALRARGFGGLGVVGTIWVRVNDPNRVNEVMRTVDDLSRNSDYETASETEESFFSSFFGSLQGFVRIILIVTGLVALCIVFIAANTASTAVRERAAEIAVLRAMGFSRRSIFTMLFAETVLLSAVAGTLGVVLAYLSTTSLRAFAGWNPALGPLSSFILTPSVLVQGIVLSLLVGTLAGIVPAYGAVRRTVVEVLHEVF
jgi:putative ABC transport system permease protein